MSERLGSGINPLEGSKPKDLGLRTFGFSVPSTRHPERNEDSIAHFQREGIVMVFDGVGGVAKGEIASRTAVGVVSKELKKRQIVDVESTGYAIEEALELASYEVRQETHGGGTTAVVARVVEDQGVKTLVWGNVGDSRIYLLRDGRLSQQTVDDSPIQDVKLSDADKRKLLEDLDEVTSPEDLSKFPFQRTGDVMNDWDLERYLEEPDTEEGTEGETLEQVQEMNLHDYIYRHRHWITQMVGGREMEPVTGTLALQTGDRVLLTSDGIHDNLTRTEIEEILKSKTKDPARAIVEAARTRSLDNEHLRAKPDDMSAVVLDVKK